MAGTAQERVVVMVEAAVRRAEKLNAFKKQLQGAGMMMGKLGGISDSVTGAQLKQAQAVKRLSNAMAAGQKKAKGFKMELLGTFFFGKMLQDTFFGLLKPIMETFGVFELFSTMLQVLFLPIMESLFPIMLKVMMWFMDLDPSTQKMIGGIVVATAAFGGLLFAASAVELGLNALHDAAITGGVLSKFGKFMKTISTMELSVGWDKLFGASGYFKKEFTKDFSNLTTKFTSGFNTFAGSILGKTIFLVATVYLSYEFAKSAFAMFTDVHTSVKDRFMLVAKAGGLGFTAGALIGGLVGGPAGALPGAIIGTLVGFGVGIIVNIVDLSFEYTGIDEALFDFVRNLMSNIKKWLTRNPILAKSLEIIGFTQSIEDSLNILDEVDELQKKVDARVKKLRLPEFQNSPDGAGQLDKLFSPGQKDKFFIKPLPSKPVFNPNEPLGSPILPSSRAGVSGSEVVIQQTLNINVSNTDMIQRAIEEANRRVVDDVRRLIKT